ncbi:MAG: acetyl-CoA carboxylase biotin carboxyl carrier protein [Kiloniellales bacterium]
MGSKLDIDEKQVKRLAVLLDETGLTEIEVEEAGRRIKVARQGAPPIAHAPVAAAPAVPAAAPANTLAPSPQSSQTNDQGNAPGTVTSPMVGTIYTAPDPGAAAFVSVGDTVSEGQTLLIIEAMKVMNNLPSPRAGKVTEILVRDGQPVEYGEALMVIV